MVNLDLDYFIGFDIGGTNVKYLIREKNNVLFSGSVKTSKFKSQDELIFFIFSIIDFMILEYGEKNICGVGFGSKGRVQKNGVILSSSLKLLSGLDLVSLIGERYEFKVKVVNDASVPYFAITESVLDKNILIVTLGTGLGTAVFRNSVHIGDEYFSSIFAHKKFKDGVNEDFVSIKFLLNKISENNLDIKTPLELFNLAKSGNKIACKIFEEYGKNIGDVLFCLVEEFEVDEIYFSGGVIKGKELFLDFTKEILGIECHVLSGEVGAFGASKLF